MGKASGGRRGIYYQRAKEEGWHAETLLICYRLMRNITYLEGVKPMVDLCAVPCSWSLVLPQHHKSCLLLCVRVCSCMGWWNLSGTPEHVTVNIVETGSMPFCFLASWPST